MTLRNLAPFLLVVACATPTLQPGDGPELPIDVGAIDTPPSSDAPGDAAPDTITSCTTTIPDTTGVGRPDACVVVPSGTMPANGWPVFFAYHAVGDTYQAALSRLGMNQVTTWAIVVAPEGLLDAHNARYFDAGDECCDDYDADPDDVSFASDLLTTVEGLYTIDSSKVFIGGISNGSFMTFAVLCADARFKKGIAASGAPPTSCANPITVRDVHGTNDHTIYYDDNNPTCPGGAPCKFEGQSTLTPYPSAEDMTPFGCTGLSATGVTKDYDASQAGAESVEYQATGCPTGTTIDFFSMTNSLHIPSWKSLWQTDNKTWLLAP